MNANITRATILQIIPFPQVLWRDECNQTFGAALVEVEGTWEDGEAFHGRDILPLHADLTVAFPSHCVDAVYEAHALGGVDGGRDFLYTTPLEHRQHGAMDEDELAAARSRAW